VDTSLGQTFVRVQGPATDPPLVLLPGDSENSLVWIPVIEAPSADHRTYALDHIADIERIPTTHVSCSSWTADGYVTASGGCEFRFYRRDTAPDAEVIDGVPVRWTDSLNRWQNHPLALPELAAPD